MWSEAQLRHTLLGAAGVGAILCALLFVLDVSVTLGRRRGRGSARLADALERRSPALLRHVVELTVTALLTLGSARPALASTTPIRDWVNQTPTTTTTLVLRSTTTTTTTLGVQDPVPAAPVPAPPAPSPINTTATTPTPAAPSRGLATYVVKSGDCLWRIAARQLGSSATNTAIDAAWRSIYRLNRAVIGENPNLIHPGLTIMLPPALNR